MITDEQAAKRAHDAEIGLIVCDLLLRIGFALMRLQDGYITRDSEQMASARRMLNYKQN